TRQRLAHRPLQLKDRPKGIANTDLLPGNAIITRILKQERAEGTLAQHKEPHKSSQPVKTCPRVVTQKIEDQGKLPQWVWVIEGPQFSPRHRPLDSGLKRGGFGNAPRAPGWGREDQRH